MSRPGLVVDASGLIALTRLELVEAAARAIGTLYVTEAAFSEATVPGMPGAEAVAAARAPGWFEVIPVEDDGSVLGLGAGETATIIAARDRGLVAALDDQDARRVAARQGVPITGTVSLLVRLVRLGVAGPIGSLLDRLDAIGFRCSSSVRAWAVGAAAVTSSDDDGRARPGT